MESGFGSISRARQNESRIIIRLCCIIEEEMQGTDRSCKTEAHLRQAPGHPAACGSSRRLPVSPAAFGAGPAP